VGGGKAFGPKPRSYAYRLNRKVRQGALKVALSQLVRENSIVVVDGWGVEKPRTKEALAALGTLGVDRALVVDVDNPGLKKSVANAHAYKYLSQLGVNVYDLLKFGKMVITVPALQAIEARLGGAAGGARD
jgi:large subunit ribosomal protein L4